MCLRKKPIQGSLLLLVLLAFSACGGAAGGTGGEPSISSPFTHLYPASVFGEFIDYLGTDAGSDDCTQSGFLRDTEYTAVLKGDISGTEVGFNLWLNAVGGNEIDISILLTQGGEEKLLAAWEGITTNQSDEVERVSNSAAIDEQETSAGDELTLKLACSGVNGMCYMKYGCLDSYIIVPNIGDAGVDKPEKVDCSLLSIAPSITSITFGEEVAFSVENGKPPYTWSVSGDSGSIIDADGNYTAGNQEGEDFVLVTDSNRCQDSLYIDVLANTN